MDLKNTCDMQNKMIEWQLKKVLKYETYYNYNFLWFGLETSVWPWYDISDEEITFET